MQELPFLHSARRLLLIDICMKFREDSLRGFQVTERTGFLKDRQTDRRPGKNNMSPDPEGGRHNYIRKQIPDIFMTFQNLTCIYTLNVQVAVLKFKTSHLNPTPLKALKKEQPFT